MLNVKWFLAFGFANNFRLTLAEHLSKIMCTRMRTPSPKQCHSNPWSFEGISGQSAAWSEAQKLFGSFSVSYCTVFSYIRCKQSSSKLILVKMNICQGFFDACSTKLLFIVFSASFGSNNFICSGMFEYVLVCSCSVQCWNKYVCVPF